MRAALVHAFIAFAGALGVSLILTAPSSASAYWYQLHHGACVVPNNGPLSGNSKFHRSTGQFYANDSSQTQHVLCPVPSFSTFQLTTIDDVIVYGYDASTGYRVEAYAGVAYENSNGGLMSGRYDNGLVKEMGEYAIQIGNWFQGRGNSNYGYVRVSLPPVSTFTLRGIYFHRP